MLFADNEYLMSEIYICYRCASSDTSVGTIILGSSDESEHTQPRIRVPLGPLLGEFVNLYSRH
jgi:hypothetical protein